jgi:hypothetical protein
MNLSKDMLFQILAYHQVAPCYLNFIVCSGIVTMNSYLCFGGFRSQNFLTVAGPSNEPLNRSGRHYQLSIKLQSIQRDPDWNDFRRNKQEYRVTSAAIYHQFDTETGGALWIITSPLQNQRYVGLANPLWEEIRNCLRIQNHSIASDEVAVRFAGSLDILAQLAEWAIGDAAYYIHQLDQSLEDIVSFEARYMPCGSLSGFWPPWSC